MTLLADLRWEAKGAPPYAAGTGTMGSPAARAASMSMGPMDAGRPALITVCAARMASTLPGAGALAPAPFTAPAAAPRAPDTALAATPPWVPWNTELAAVAAVNCWGVYTVSTMLLGVRKYASLTFRVWMAGYVAGCTM